MADGVLPRDDGAVFKAGGDVMGEIRDDGREDGGAGFVHATDDGEEVDCGFEASGEETGAGEEEIADGGGLKIERRTWGAGAFKDFEVQVGEDRADEEGLRCRDGAVQGRREVEEGEKLGGGGSWGRRKTMVEEMKDTSIGSWNKADKTALKESSVEVELTAIWYLWFKTWSIIYNQTSIEWHLR
ncbi:MAG: hypothetical protein Q9216_001332 [Gyalolechia sp. 2 TL-2023]